MAKEKTIEKAKEQVQNQPQVISFESRAESPNSNMSPKSSMLAQTCMEESFGETQYRQNLQQNIIEKEKDPDWSNCDITVSSNH